MNCTTFEQWLSSVSGQRERALPGDAAAHLADCAGCRARWTAEAQLDAAIATWREAPLPIPPTEPITQAVLEASPWGKLPASQPTAAIRAEAGSFGHLAGVRTSRAMWTTVACALAVLIAVSWGLRSPRPRTEVAGPGSSRSQLVSTVPVSDSVAELWTDVQVTSQSVAHETVQALEGWSTLPAGAVTTAPVAAPTALPATPALRPISERVNTAFGFLSDVLPAPGSSG